MVVGKRRKHEQCEQVCRLFAFEQQFGLEQEGTTIDNPIAFPKPGLYLDPFARSHAQVYVHTTVASFAEWDEDERLLFVRHHRGSRDRQILAHVGKRHFNPRKHAGFQSPLFVIDLGNEWHGARTLGKLRTNEPNLRG